jgi:hypothetical protein
VAGRDNIADARPDASRRWPRIAQEVDRRRETKRASITRSACGPGDPCSGINEPAPQSEQPISFQNHVVFNTQLVGGNKILLTATPDLLAATPNLLTATNKVLAATQSLLTGTRNGVAEG